MSRLLKLTEADFSLSGQSGRTKRLNHVDYIALAVAAVVFGFLFCTATVGMGPIDESFYYSIVERQLAGDRLLVDDWHLSQLSSVLQILPYWFFVTVTGSTEGMILYLRFLYLTVDLILYWYLYGKLRKYGGWTVLSAALFCTCIPSTIRVLGYYTMAMHGLVVTALLIGFGKEKKSVPTLLLTGVVIACTVLAEPVVAFLYFIWCILVLLRALFAKKGKSFLEGYAFALNGRLWLFVTVGIVLTSAVFFTWLLSKSSFVEIVKSIPEFFTDYEYSIQGKKQGSVIDFRKIFDAMRFFGFLPVVGFLLFVPCALWRRAGKLRRFRLLLFVAVAICFVGSYAVAAFWMVRSRVLIGIRFMMPTAIWYYYFQGLPVLFFCIDCYALCEKKDQRISLFLLLGFAASIMVDLSSELMIGVCVAVSFPAAVVSLRDLVRELIQEREEKPAEKNENKNKRMAKKRLPAAFAALCLTALLCWEGFSLYTIGFYGVVERIANYTDDRAVTATIPSGPMKGIRTTMRVCGIYEDILSDLDVIKANAKGPVYVTRLCTYYYIYMNLSVGSYATWYVEEDSETRQTRYWELHPEKHPDYIYVPFYDSYYYLTSEEREVVEKGMLNISAPQITDSHNNEKDKVRFLQTLCDCEVTEGKAGYILRVVRWRN